MLRSGCVCGQAELEAFLALDLQDQEHNVLPSLRPMVAREDGKRVAALEQIAMGGVESWDPRSQQLRL